MILWYHLDVSNKLLDAKWRKYASVNQAIIGSDNGLSPVRAKPVYEPETMLDYFLYNLTIRKLQWNFKRNSKFYWTNRIWKCRLQNGGHFVLASTC